MGNRVSRNGWQSVMLAASVLCNIALAGKLCSGGFRLPAAGDTTRVTVVDTVRCRQTVPVDSAVVRYVAVRLPAAKAVSDTAVAGGGAPAADSVAAVLPVTQTEYRDSSYRAWVSGYGARLDSIQVYARRETVTVTRTEASGRWHLGVTAGCGATAKGLQPFVGIGITYSIISF